MNEIGRNDPCPCGSGKKHKKCCLGKTTPPSRTHDYRRLSEAYNRLPERLLPLALHRFGKACARVAMKDFLGLSKTPETIPADVNERNGSLFWAWFFFNWRYDAARADVKLPGPEGRTLAEIHARDQPARTDPLERRLLDALNRAPFTFFEVMEVDKGRGLRLLDLFREETVAVEEQMGSQNALPGYLLFGRAVTVDGVGMLAGNGSTFIPDGYKARVLELKQRMLGHMAAVDDHALDDWAADIRRLYLAIEQHLSVPTRMCNTDGHPLEFHRLVYQVPSAEEAFDKLWSLCVTADPEELRADARRDAAGRIVHVEFPWERISRKATPGIPGTVLGQVVIDGTLLSVAVNSAARARSIRREIKARLGAGARLQSDQVQDPEAMLEAYAAQGGSATDHQALAQDPEVQRQVAAMLARHWEDWIHQKIPALGGKTPRQAVKSPDGRRAVEDLLLGIQCHPAQDPLTAEANRKGVLRARELLGLDDR